MKKLIVIVLVMVGMLSMTGCNTKSMNYIIENKPSVTGIVEEVHDDCVIVYSEATDRNVNETETITFHDKTFNKADLSQETIEWLEWYNELSKEDQLAISYIPSEVYELSGYPEAETIDAETELIADTTEEKNDSNEEIALLTDTFWDDVTKVAFYDFNEDIYEVSDAGKLEELQAIFAEMTYKEIKNPWLEGLYLFEIHTTEKNMT